MKGPNFLAWRRSTEIHGMKDLVSVIIPVYNVAPYLREALDSVINQTYKNLEILIIDDGSTDGSGEVCDEYLTDPRVRVVHQENMGLSGARNVGLDIMTGEYVSFLDPDDVFLPEMIQRTMEAMEKSGTDIVACSYQTYQTEGLITRNRLRTVREYHFKLERLTSPIALKRILSGKINISVWNKLYRKCLWNTIRFPKGFVYEDVWVMPQLFYDCKYFLTLPEVYYLHRKRKGSITGTESVKNHRDAVQARKKLREFVELHTPEIYSPTDVDLLYQQEVRSLSFLYGEMIYLKRLPKEAGRIKREAMESWKALEGERKSAKTKAVYFLFRYMPHLLFPMRKCWLLIKRKVLALIMYAVKKD